MKQSEIIESAKQYIINELMTDTMNNDVFNHIVKMFPDKNMTNGDIKQIVNDTIAIACSRIEGNIWLGEQ